MILTKIGESLNVGGEKMPKRDIKKDPNIRPSEKEFQICRFCGTMFEYGDVPCPNCHRKPSDEEKLSETWAKSEQK